MTTKRLKRPRDPIELGKLIGDILTGQIEDRQAVIEGQNPDATEFARKGGLKGGAARAKALTPQRRVEIAKKAAKLRWAVSG